MAGSSTGVVTAPVPDSSPEPLVVSCGDDPFEVLPFVLFVVPIGSLLVEPLSPSPVLDPVSSGDVVESDDALPSTLTVAQ